MDFSQILNEPIDPGAGLTFIRSRIQGGQSDSPRMCCWKGKRNEAAVAEKDSDDSQKTWTPLSNFSCFSPQEDEDTQDSMMVQPETQPDQDSQDSVEVLMMDLPDFTVSPSSYGLR